MTENKQEIVQAVVQNPELLNEVINTQEAQTIIVQRSEMSMHSGPLPSPKSMAEYAAHIPDFGERIMAYAEREQAARHELARKTLQMNRLGLCFGLVSLVVITLFCTYLAVSGSIKAAAWVMGAVLVAIVSIFVLGRNHQKS